MGGLYQGRARPMGLSSFRSSREGKGHALMKGCVSLSGIDVERDKNLLW